MHCLLVSFILRPFDSIIRVATHGNAAVQRSTGPIDVIQVTNLILGGSWIYDSLARLCVLGLLRRSEAEDGWSWVSLILPLSQNRHLTAG